jgi:hypothetical protein
MTAKTNQLYKRKRKVLTFDKDFIKRIKNTKFGLPKEQGFIDTRNKTTANIRI